MSDPNLLMQRQMQELQDGHEHLRKADVAAIYLPWTQRSLNPIALAASPAAWGDVGQPWGVNLIAFYVSVFVQTTNNATNFWVVRLVDTAGTVLARIDTNSPVATANTWTRYVDTVIVQPSASNVTLTITATATLSPGAIFVVPALALLRTGN